MNRHLKIIAKFSLLETNEESEDAKISIFGKQNRSFTNSRLKTICDGNSYIKDLVTLDEEGQEAYLKKLTRSWGVSFDPQATVSDVIKTSRQQD